MNPTNRASTPKSKRPTRTPKLVIRDLLNALVLTGSLLVIVALSFEVLYDTSGTYEGLYLQVQFGVCLVFLTDFFYRFYLSKERGKYLRRNLIFFLVSIPLLNLSTHFEWELSHGSYYLLRLLPLIRGGYGLALMVGWFTQSRLTNLLLSYITTILAFTYFASLIFYSIEKGSNPAVTGFGDALWWAFMDMTTVGSNIYAHTEVGKVLSVLLAAAGMMMFPIFTVYITDRFRTHHRGRKEEQLGREGSPPTSKPNL